MRTYTVTYRRDPKGWWVASVRGVSGCHTQGRSIRQARQRIREALALVVDDAERAQLEDDIRLPREAQQLLAGLEAARARAETEQARARAAALAAVRSLTSRLHLSVRDAGELVGLSHQRVQQLLSR